MSLPGLATLRTFWLASSLALFSGFQGGCSSHEKLAETPTPVPQFERCQVEPPFQTLPTGGWRELLSEVGPKSLMVELPEGVLAFVQMGEEGRLVWLDPMLRTQELNLSAGLPLALASHWQESSAVVALVDRVSPGQARLRLASLRGEKLLQLRQVASFALPEDCPKVGLALTSEALYWCEYGNPGRLYRLSLEEPSAEPEVCLAGLSGPCGLAVGEGQLLLAEFGQHRYLSLPLPFAHGTLTPRSPAVQKYTVAGMRGPTQVVATGGGFVGLEQGGLRWLKARAAGAPLEPGPLVASHPHTTAPAPPHPPPHASAQADASAIAAVPVDPRLGRIEFLLTEHGETCLLSLDAARGALLERQVLATRVGRPQSLMATPGNHRELVFHFAFEAMKDPSGRPGQRYRWVRQRFPARTQPAGTPAQLTRAARIHADACILLAHDHDPSRQGFLDFRAGNVAAKAIMLTTDGVDWNRRLRTRCLPDRESWIERWKQHLEDLEVLQQESDSGVLIVRQWADIERARKLGKVGAILAVEGVLPPTLDSLEWLRELHGRGLRQLQIFWQLPNDRIINKQRLLSDCALEIVRECNRLGIVISTSHLWEEANLQVAEVSTDPVLRCHDTPQRGRVYGESTDRMIQAIARSGGGRGVFALHFVQGYLERADVVTLVDCIDHVRDLVGIDHVALGGDYFPEDDYHFAVQHVSRLEELTLEMVRRDYSEEDIRKVLGLNLLRLYRDVWQDPPGHSPTS